MTTGKVLRTEREAAEVQIVRLAEAMGVSRSTIWIIEKSAKVQASKANAYRAALATFGDIATRPVEAAETD